MAGVPNAPPKPQYISSTDTTMTVQFFETQKSNGAPITGYQVWRDIGDNQSDLIIQETLYDGHSMQFTIVGMNPGSIYKIASLAMNS
jgi:hypothetical protein